MPITSEKKRALTGEHKQAMALGRKQSKVINQYLTVIQAEKPKRGRKRTVESIQRQLDEIDAKLKDASPVVRLNLMSQQRVLQADLQRLEEKQEIDGLEEQFVEVAKDFGERKGIEYKTWREFGVPSEVLEKAGIGR